MRTRKFNPQKFVFACITLLTVLTVIALTVSIFRYIEHKIHVEKDYPEKFSGNASMSNGLNSIPSGSNTPGKTNVFKSKLPVNWASIKKGALPILMYHAVDDNAFGDKELFMPTHSFDEQMKYLHNNGYTTIDFSDIKNYKKYKKPIIITFDDGYKIIIQMSIQSSKNII